MRVLVTGASGHVGGAVARLLVESGNEVAGISRRPCSIPGVEYLSVDLSKPDATTRLLGELAPCEAVVHAAAAIDMDPLARATVATNCFGTQQVLAAVLKWRANLVYTSSIGVIGRPMELPVTEAHPVNPLTTYHSTKLCGEHLVAAAARQGVRATSLRVSSPIGPAMPSGRIFSTFVSQAAANDPIMLLGRGGRRQNYVDVRDVARAVELLCDRPATTILNIAGSRSISNLELAELCTRELDSRSSISLAGEDPEEEIRWEISIERAQGELGWRPRRGLGDSIRAVAEGLSR